MYHLPLKALIGGSGNMWQLHYIMGHVNIFIKSKEKGKVENKY